MNGYLKFLMMKTLILFGTFVSPIGEGQRLSRLSLMSAASTLIARLTQQLIDHRHDAVTDGDVVTHLATAMSVRDLQEQVSKLCPARSPIPSV